MTIRVSINGFGRIGRDLFRIVIDRGDADIEVVAINDIMPADTMAHLLRHDSTYGLWPHEVRVDGPDLYVDGSVVRVTSEREPARLAWADVNADVVVEATGKFRNREAAGAHLTAGARKVVLSAPGKGVDTTIVMGVNDHHYQPLRDHIISNASCTTNCVAPMLWVLHRHFVIQRGLLTTVHSYTSDQNLLDGPHKDARRARSAAVNIIPTTTGAAAAVGQILPELAGLLDGVAVRVPVEDGSLSDLTVQVQAPVRAEDVNAAFAEAADTALKGVLRYSTEPLVSRDIIGDPASCVFDAGLTRVRDGLVKVFGWYDNEWGYAARLADLVLMVGASRP
ncbi:MAG TPA: type I glyceraldehyde-3-phosphate dehydrogenase [Pseudonocardiaceae bacterium]|nr:type I glyceraldehyde-3-phosphate dehydrogenase [Pseudonocardiaceae bacterium]